MKNYLFLPFLFFAYLSVAQCPKWGDATEEKEQELNRGKNKSARVPQYEAEELSLNQFISSKKVHDEDYWWPGAYVVTEGYLVDFKEQGPESANCNEASKSEKNGDVHMYLGLIPDAPLKHTMIVEVTPQYKKIHPNYDFSPMKKQKVRVYGYLLYDFEHTGNSVNYCTACNLVWRKTCWEIHPVTKIELL